MRRTAASAIHPQDFRKAVATDGNPKTDDKGESANCQWLVIKT
jgi:hypothetical protein